MLKPCSRRRDPSFGVQRIQADFCKAIAWDKQTQTIYLLIDNLGIEKYLP